MRRYLALLMAGLFCFGTAYAAEVRKLGSNDLEWATPNQGVETTKTSPAGKSVTKIDAAQVPFRNANGYVDDLVDGVANLSISVSSLTATTITATTFVVTTDNIANANIANLDVTDTTPTFVDNTINGADLIDNTVAVGKLTTSGTASSSTYLRGDGAWTAIANAGGITGQSKNLIAKSVADDQNVDIDADYVILFDTSNNAYLASSVNLTVDLASSGANGLDTGSLAANTGYYLYVIYNGSTVAGLASTSASSPTMPTGYTYKALVSWCTTDATGTPFNILEFKQIDDVYKWAATIETVHSGGSATTASVSLAAGGAKSYAVVPPNIAKQIRFKAAGDTASVWMNGETFASTATADGTTTEVFCTMAGSGYGCSTILLTVLESQTYYHQCSSTNNCHHHVVGFSFKR